jgi:hypothetical protein
VTDTITSNVVADNGRQVGLADDLRATLSFLSAASFGLAVVLNVFAATLFASLGLVLLSLSFGQWAGRLSRRVSLIRLAAAVVTVALVSALISDPLNGVPRIWLAVAVPSIVIAFVVAGLTSAWPRRHPLVTGTTVIVIALITGIALIHDVKDAGIDVVLLHRQAAMALGRGENPYGASVSVPNGSPDVPPGSRIVGYPYPPVAVLVYASSTWLWGDPRWASLALWIVLAVCGLLLFRGRQDTASVLPFFLLSVLPGWAMMLRTGWTEMLSAALIALAAATWKRPIVSGIALGAALASKQYLIVALPLIVFYRGDRWRQRSAAACATAILCVLPAFAWSPGDAWRSMVVFHALTPARTDSSNFAGVLALLGIHWNPPVWIGLGVSLMLTSLLTRRAAGPGGPWRAMAAGLAAFLLLSSQAMPNYWFLAAVVAVFGSQCDAAASYGRA